MPADLTTLPHFSVSSTMNFANSPDVIDLADTAPEAAPTSQAEELATAGALVLAHSGTQVEGAFRRTGC
jgi:hypothetical protein